MDQSNFILALAALGQPTRLETFRALIRKEPNGIAAGELARTLAIPQNTMSTHLSVLAHAGLVRSNRRGRSIIYRAELEQLRHLVTFLLQDCCDGRPSLCAPSQEIFASSQPKKRECT